MHGAISLAEARPVLFQNAAIHHHEDSGFARLLRRRFVDHTFLQPDRRNLQLNRLFHDFADVLGSPEHIHQIDLLRHVNRYCKQ